MPDNRGQPVAGPKWGLATAAYFTASVAVHILTYRRFEIAEVSFATCWIVAGLLIVAGILVYCAALLSLRKGISRGALVTSGLYSIVRHPLYASAILLIVPGAAIAFRSWLTLPAPLVAYAAFRVFIRDEEAALVEQYGPEYESYRDRTNAIFPIRLRRTRR